MFQVTKNNIIPCIAALTYILIFSYATSEIEWYNIPNPLIWLGAIPAGLGMWIKSCTE
jgi:hypothetical protein